MKQFRLLKNVSVLLNSTEKESSFELATQTN